MARKKKSKKKKTTEETSKEEEITSQEETSEEEPEEVKEKAEEADTLEDKAPEKKPKKEEKEEAPEKSEFVSVIEGVTKALNSPAGKRLNCRVKVIAPDNQAIVYQGLRNNVWGRIYKDKKHDIYRHPLRKLLQNFEETKEEFKPENLRR